MRNMEVQVQGGEGYKEFRFNKEEGGWSGKCTKER